MSHCILALRSSRRHESKIKEKVVACYRIYLTQTILAIMNFANTILLTISDITYNAISLCHKPLTPIFMTFVVKLSQLATLEALRGGGQIDSPLLDFFLALNFAP